MVFTVMMVRVAISTVNFLLELDCIMEQLGMYVVDIVYQDRPVGQWQTTLPLARLHCDQYPSPETAIQHSIMGQPTQNSE